MFKRVDREKNRLKRHKRIRRKVKGTPSTPRLCVFRSGKHIYAQVIDDVNAVTLVSASTLEKNIGSEGKNMEAAQKVGETVAKRALEKGIEAVVFDRGGYIYQGRIKALADAAREAGLKL
ncbi:50S ribosomal protein L18 [Peptoniphilus sp. GNH]|nr:ribosomal protein L18 [Clostridiales bacterium KA00134]UHR02485.1 50S ribosomal protein L18 [Peptoniphilus sp. GNH]